MKNEKTKQNEVEIPEGYEIISTIREMGGEFVLAEKKSAVSPYVVWTKNGDNVEYQWGQYFQSKDSAIEGLYATALHYIRESNELKRGISEYKIQTKASKEPER